MSTSRYGADLTIPGRFRGPARSGNGGYTAGSLAERLLADSPRSAVEVTLRQPPPLDVAMTVQHADAADAGNVTGADVTWLLMGGAKIAEARIADTDLDPVDPVSPEEARAAEAGFPGLHDHPFPTCFACGTSREPGDGMRIFPGPTDDGGVAALWMPDVGLAERQLVSGLPDEPARVGLGCAWAALDCIGGWAGDMAGRKMVLGRMTAQVDDLPAVGEPHVVVGAMRDRQGRKTFTASTMYDSDERIVARAEHVWIAIDPSAFN